jgi:hypothetical protein
LRFRPGAKRGAKELPSPHDPVCSASARAREDAVYFDAAKDPLVGAVSLGFGPDGKRTRRKVTARTKQEVRDKLKALHAELDRGLRTSAAYTVQKAVNDWLEGGLPGRSERTRSVYKEALTPLMGQIGNRPLKELTAGDVRAGPEALSDRLPTRHLQIAKASLARVIRYAERTIVWDGTWPCSSIRLRVPSGGWPRRVQAEK